MRGGRVADDVIPSTRGDEALDNEVFERLDRRPAMETGRSSCARGISARGRRGVALPREEVLTSPVGDVEVLWSWFSREETIKDLGGSLSGDDIAGWSASVSESLPADIVSGASVAFSSRARLAVNREDMGEEELASTSTSECVLFLANVSVWSWFSPVDALGVVETATAWAAVRRSVLRDSK